MLSWRLWTQAGSGTEWLLSSWDLCGSESWATGLLTPLLILLSMRQTGACPGFGGSDLEKECESGWGGVPASSAQAMGAGCQAAAAVAATQSSVPVALSQKLGEGVSASSTQNGTVAPSRGDPVSLVSLPRAPRQGDISGGAPTAGRRREKET